MTQAKQTQRPKAQPKQPKVQQVRRQRKPHPTDGWFTLGKRVRYDLSNITGIKEQA